jgi:predicted ATPase
MPHLRQIERLDGPGTELTAAFPWSIPAVRTLGVLEIDPRITFFVGSNGSGKSTVLEAIAAAASLPTVGFEEIGRDATLRAQRQLARLFRLVWNKRIRRGFFLRAEDFFGFVRRVAQMRLELQSRLSEIAVEFRDATPLARGLAAGPVNASLLEIEARYGTDLDASSHGETFLKLFQSRFVPGGLYLMDEPEAALSPQSQLGLMALLADMVQANSQFIIATHSPILLAWPGACIYSFDSTPIERVGYEDLEHVNLTRSFLADPQRYLRHIITD